jgi:hypothetical protein
VKESCSTSRPRLQGTTSIPCLQPIGAHQLVLSSSNVMGLKTTTAAVHNVRTCVNAGFLRTRLRNSLVDEMPAQCLINHLVIVCNFELASVLEEGGMPGRTARLHGPPERVVCSKCHRPVRAGTLERAVWPHHTQLADCIAMESKVVCAAFVNCFFCSMDIWPEHLMASQNTILPLSMIQSAFSEQLCADL